MKRLLFSSLFVHVLFYALSQSPNLYEEEVIGYTYYDLQTWRAMQNRLHMFDDGTFGSVWCQAENWPGFPDMGVGYGYFDGNNWSGSAWPFQSITSVWATFPSYSPFGDNGELCFSQGETGLIMSSRNEKGTGDWNENYSSGTNFKHPCVVTSGPDNHFIHLLYLDPEPEFVGFPAQPDKGTIHYSRSTDSGITWDPENIIIPGTGPDYYSGFTIGAYCWAQPNGNTLAFVAGDFHTDLILLKSDDGGDNWQKTVIWEHPYPFFELGSFISDTFYCNDGGISVAMDNEGKAHVSFTLSRVYSTNNNSDWYVKEIDGVVYWNEERETFSNNINALNPYGHPDSELIVDYNLIGWSQDVNGNGELDILDDFGTYPTPGMSTMSQITVDENNQIIVAWSGVTETYDNGLATYRHIWARSSTENGNYWGNFVDLNEDLIFIFSENIYPALSKKMDYEYFFTTFQEDTEPGLSGGEPPYSENKIWFLPEFFGWIPTTVVAGFTADTTVIHVGDTVQFINLSYGYPPDMITYSWLFDGGMPAISNDTNPEIVYLEEGIFDVELTANISSIAWNTCLKTDYITVLPSIGIEDIGNDKKIAIYPNPSAGKMIVHLPESKGKLRIFNSMGELVFEFPVDQKKLEIDLSEELPGIFLLEFSSKNVNFVEKVLIQ